MMIKYVFCVVIITSSCSCHFPFEKELFTDKCKIPRADLETKLNVAKKELSKTKEEAGEIQETINNKTKEAAKSPDAESVPKSITEDWNNFTTLNKKIAELETDIRELESRRPIWPITEFGIIYTNFDDNLPVKSSSGYVINVGLFDECARMKDICYSPNPTWFTSYIRHNTIAEIDGANRNVAISTWLESAAYRWDFTGTKGYVDFLIHFGLQRYGSPEGDTGLLVGLKSDLRLPLSERFILSTGVGIDRVATSAYKDETEINYNTSATLSLAYSW
jgi:hypothetical protein